MMIKDKERRSDAAEPAAAVARRPGCIDALIEVLNRPIDPEAEGAQLAAAVAAVLDAQHCSIAFIEPGPEASRSRVYASSRTDADGGGAKEPVPATAADDLRPGAAGSRVMSVPIRCDGAVLGVMTAYRATEQRRFDDADRELAAMVGCVLGRCVQVTRLQSLLRSRFARVALATSGAEGDVGAMLEPAVYPDRMARLLARSFYREMRRAGLGSVHIINAASEIISQLTSGLKAKARTDSNPA